ncbi:MAG TPA: SH3 domain-containing protein [Blastocatellia bacterium]|nr:SH3 domain-containing protein [Blastocatellia bacterium]
MPKTFSRAFSLSLISVLIFLSAQAGGRQQGRKLLPVDEAYKDKTFLAFRDRLLEAAKNRDSKFVMSAVHSRIRNSFGDSGGVGEFRKKWKPERPDSELWDTLVEILSLGGAFRNAGKGSDFWAPYVFSSFPEDMDSFEYVAVTGENVNVRQKADPASPVISILSYDLVKAPEGLSGKKAGDWVKIVLPGGKDGFVSARFLRSPVDYRASFTRVKGRWMMSALVAGD